LPTGNTPLDGRRSSRTPRQLASGLSWRRTSCSSLSGRGAAPPPSVFFCLTNHTGMYIAYLDCGGALFIRATRYHVCCPHEAARCKLPFAFRPGLSRGDMTRTKEISEPKKEQRKSCPAPYSSSADATHHQVLVYKYVITGPRRGCIVRSGSACGRRCGGGEGQRFKDRDLSADERCSQAVLAFLSTMDVGSDFW